MISGQTVDVAAIEAARRRITPFIRKTPLVEDDLLNARLGARIFVKAEPLQRGGSFKIRGALSALTALSNDQLMQGVIAFSSGNHAIAVATAARLLGTTATIIMPADAPVTKIERSKANGAAIITYDRATEDREAICSAIARERGFVTIKPFDDPLVISGQGTIGLEIAEQAKAMGAELDAIVVPCSGGGLAAGCAIALRDRMPGIQVLTAEPNGFDDIARSLAGEEGATNKATTGSICDALLVPTPGKLTLPILQAAGATGLTISDCEAIEAVRAGFETFKLVSEPGGAAGLAAVLAQKFDLAGKTIAVVLSGGNADRAVLARALEDANDA